MKREDEARKLNKLITDSWKVAKGYFEIEPETAEEFNQFTELLNDFNKAKMTEYGAISKEYKFIRRMLTAIDEYCDQDWRETHQGIQRSLFDEGSN